MVITVSCTDCEKLHNVAPDDEQRDLWERRPPEEPVGLACPKNPSHRITPWRDPWPCPVCGGPMKNDHSMICNWD